MGAGRWRDDTSSTVGFALATFVPNNMKENLCGTTAVVTKDPYLQNLSQMMQEKNALDNEII